MSHVVLYQDADGERIEEFDAVDAALARLQELHESGNTTGRVYREIAVKVETVVKVSLGDGDPTPTPTSTPPPPPMPSADADDSDADAPRSKTGIDFVAPSA